jgi:energy-coupling factor transport system permease protein
VVELYVPGRTHLHATDPRVKLLGVVCALVTLFLAKNLYFMLAALVVAHLLYWSARIPADKLAVVWKALLPVSVLMALLWTLFNPSGAPILQVWIFSVTPLALAQGLVLALRILNIGLIVTLWLYTTDTVAIVASLVKLGMPYAWSLVLALALRYIPFVQESYTTISDAQQARGLQVGQGNVVRRVRAMLPIFIAMMISGLRASEHVARALESRGFGGGGTRRTSLYEPGATARDYIAAVALVVGLGVFLWLYFAFGFATQAVGL